MSKTLVIIPARYESTRFPGKPLALLGGKPVIQWVWEAVSPMAEVAKAVVATDDSRILSAVEGFGGVAMMTSSTHRSGTDRCAEVLAALEARGERYDAVVNVQGDEPFITADTVRTLIRALDGSDIATLCTPIHDNAELFSPNNVKVVFATDGRALYFSRQPIPYQRGVAEGEWVARHRYFKHIGIYGFAGDTLSRVARLPQGELERCESLEQLRWLENGFSIAVSEVAEASVGIDTPADLELANNIITKKEKK